MNELTITLGEPRVIVLLGGDRSLTLHDAQRLNASALTPVEAAVVAARLRAWADEISSFARSELK